MHTTFPRAMSFIFEAEGGYVNHPKDPGGCTNMGITLATLRAWLKKRASCEDVRRLSKETATDIYKKNYWDMVRGDDLPLALDLCVFDMGVNAGPSMAAKLLQRLVGVDDDGIIGPITLAGAHRFSMSSENAIGLYSKSRSNYYRGLSTFKYFGKGWLNRVEKCERLANELLLDLGGGEDERPTFPSLEERVSALDKRVSILESEF